MNRLDFPYDAVVLASGDYPSAALPLRCLTEAPYVVCCDGAANEYLRRGYVPDAIIGDGDSLATAYRRTYAHLFHPVACQETNDQTKAVNFLAARGMRRLLLLGATGRREDHTLGNIFLLMEYLKADLDVRMLTDHGLFTPMRGTHTFASHKGQQISLFRLGATGLSATGLAYPLRDFTALWQGTLNEALGETFTITAQGDYLMYQTL
ncbi:MAG: thiamine diphosphokinase [Bacteroides sp.]